MKQKSTKTTNSLKLKGFVLMIMALMFNISTINAQIYFDLSSGNYSQNFNGITTLPTNFSTVAINATGSIPSATRTTVASTSALSVVSTSAAVGIDAATSTQLVFLTTGGTDNTSSIAVELNLNFTGRTAGNLSYTAQTIFNSTGNRNGSLRVYYTTDLSTWTELTGTNLPYVATNNVVGSGSVNIALPAALNNQSTVKLRFYYHNGTGGTTGSRPRIGIDNLTVTSTPAGGPTLTWTPTSLSGLTATAPSAGLAVTASIAGSALTPPAGNITVTAPANFEVSLDGVTFSSSVVIPYSGGALSATDVDVRIAATAPAGAVSGNVSASGGSASSNLAVSGTMVAPIVNATPTTVGKLFANLGNPSTGATFNVNGSTLSSDLTVGPLAGYEFSTSSTFASVSSSLSISPVSGTVASTPVYVRLTGASVGTFNGNIPVASTGATTVNVAITGQVYGNGTGNFTPGNIVTLRVGEAGGPALTGAATQVFLDEYTLTGTFVQSKPLPFNNNSLGAGNAKYTLSGSSTSEGYLNLSPDGKFLTFGGYDSNIGTANVASTNSSTVNRVVARVDYTGAINTETRISDGYNTSNIRSAATLDGNAYWTGGAGGAGIGGVRYVTQASSGTSTSISSGANGNTRGTAVYNSQLFVSAAAGSNRGISTVGTGLPITTGQPMNMISGTTDNVETQGSHGFVFVDVDNDAVPDILYVADNTSGANFGLIKFSNTGGVWTKRGNLPNTAGRAIYGVTAFMNGANRDIIVTVGTGSAIATEIYKFTDISAVTDNITSNGTDIVTAMGTPIITGAVGVGFKGVSFVPVEVITPEIDFTFTTPASTIVQGQPRAPIYSVQMDNTGGNAVLTSVSVQTGGSYAAADFDNFQLILSTDATLDNSDPVLSTRPSVSSGGNINFTGLGQSIPASSTRYLFVTGTISGCTSVIGNTINITSTPLANFTFTNGATIKTGTPAAGSLKNIGTGTPSNITSLAAPANLPQINASWTNPIGGSCFNDVLVVVHTSPITASPLTTTYTFNNNYALATTFPGGGRVVYQGNGTSVNVVNLPVGVTYYVKVFTRLGSQWSSGSQISVFVNSISYFSRASGNTDDAIWALTPTGTPATIASLGGFSSSRSLVIQSGHNIILGTSNTPVFNLTVNAGGRFYRNSTDPLDFRYLNVFGNIICNGDIGNGTTFDAIGFGVEGLNVTTTGTGNFNAGRFRKNTATNATSTLTINSNVNIRFAGNGAFYNNTDNTTLNLTIASGRTLNITDATGGLAISGVDGLSSGLRSGTITVNGTVNVGGTTHFRTANASASAGIIVNSGGNFNTKDLLVNVSTGTGFATTINGNLTVSGLLNNIDGNWTPSFGTNGFLRVSGRALVSGGSITTSGKLVVLSTATATGMIDGSSVGTINGNMIVQRRVVAGASSADHMLSNPTNNIATVSAHLNDNFPVLGTFPYTFDSDPTQPQPAVFPNVWTYDPALTGTKLGWVSARLTNMVGGLGIMANVPGTRVLDFVGGHRTGTVPVSVSNADDAFNLIGNPYPQPISFNNFIASNAANLLDGFIIWNPAISNYAQFNGTLDVWTNNPGAGSNDRIALGQGFFVVASNTAVVNFENAHRTTTNAHTFFGTPVESFRIIAKANNSTDETVITMNNQSADMPKFLAPMGNQISIYTMANNKNLAFQNIENVENETIIPIGVVAGEAGKVIFSFPELAKLDNKKVYFEDLVLNKSIEVSNFETYEVNLAKGNAGSRFQLRITDNAVVSELSSNGLNVFVANNSLFIQNAGEESIKQVEVFSVSGAKVAEAQNFATQNNIEIKLPQLNTGIYLARIVNTSGNVETRKVFVK